MAAWDGEGLSQDDLMIKDECIMLDENDAVIGHANKYECHRFNEATPRGILHRAFSVFLFDSQGRLLLQQRAKSKITFPSVWTNTCCSHPLHGYDPTEVDTPEDVAQGTVMGAKRAAVRKLLHELGVQPDQVPIEHFKFLTRLHYWAADVVTHGKKSEWGEHEIDYILFIQADVDLEPNPEEVDDVKYVTLPELQEMMKPGNGLLWSPWFRIIVEQFLVHWWQDLRETLTTDRWVDVSRVHRFDPTEEHMGGGGDAGPWLGQASANLADVAKNGRSHGTTTNEPGQFNRSLKQGAYGKIPIHKESQVSQLLRIDEVFAALKYKFGNSMENKIEVTDENVKFCDDMLGKVSRSFAAVIRQLPKGLCLDVLVFYLVLRALDSIEDDMKAFPDHKIKMGHLHEFYRTALRDTNWTMTGVGEGDERVLLEQFFRVTRVFSSLPESSQEVIADIAHRMGDGMAEFVHKDLGQGTVSVAEYNRYCYFVAGLVGDGLSRLFVCNDYEPRSVENKLLQLSTPMGLFLQKTNIIRDYLEDWVDGRAFYPQEIWRKYSERGELGEFHEAEARPRALHLLNELVTDALELIPDCLEYLATLSHPEVFRFCAIPQVMAIATLDKCYNNADVFTGVVKIRKGLSVKLIQHTTTLDGMHKWFHHFAGTIRARIPQDDPNAARTREITANVRSLTEDRARRYALSGWLGTLNMFAPVVLCFTLWQLVQRKDMWTGGLLPRLTDTFDVTVLAFFAASIVYLLAFSGMSFVLSNPSTNSATSDSGNRGSADYVVQPIRGIPRQGSHSSSDATSNGGTPTHGMTTRSGSAQRGAHA